MNITTRKRSSSGSKRPKDKIVLIYEQIFMVKETHRNGTEIPDDFQDLFTLQPNAEALEAEITKLTNEQVISIKSNIVSFLIKAIENLNSGESSLYLNQF